jgi:hypothetical protein
LALALERWDWLSARVTRLHEDPILDELSAGKAVICAMNQFAQFVARLQAIARTNQNEGTQKAEVETLFGHFVLMSREAHSGERLEAERVHNDVRGLHDYLVSEVNQHYADRHGTLVEHAYGLVAHRMRKYIRA